MTRRIVVMIGELQKQREHQHQELASIQNPADYNENHANSLKWSIERLEKAISALAKLQLADIDDSLVA